MKKLLLISFSIMFLCSSIVNAEEGKTKKNAVNLDEQHKKTAAGIGESASAYIEKRYKGHKALEFCSGTFATEGEIEYVTALYDKKSAKVVYLIMLQKDYEVYKSHELLVQDINSAKEVLDGVDFQCLPIMQAKRLNKSIQESEGINGNIETRNYFDTICIWDTKNLQNSCFQFDLKKGEFVGTGGWSLD